MRVGKYVPRTRVYGRCDICEGGGLLLVLVAVNVAAHGLAGAIGNKALICSQCADLMGEQVMGMCLGTLSRHHPAAFREAWQDAPQAHELRARVKVRVEVDMLVYEFYPSASEAEETIADLMRAAGVPIKSTRSRPCAGCAEKKSATASGPLPPVYPGTPPQADAPLSVSPGDATQAPARSVKTVTREDFNL